VKKDKSASKERGTKKKKATRWSIAFSRPRASLDGRGEGCGVGSGGWRGGVRRQKSDGSCHSEKRQMKGIKRERGHGKHRKTKGSLVKSNNARGEFDAIS